MRIEVLHIEDCTNWEAAGSNVRAALAQLGDATTPVTFRLITSADEAAEVHFVGSPTIMLDGEDLFPSQGGASELACRIYFTADGVAGLPTIVQLVEAIGPAATV
ncbi:thioredoxin family protein [Leifsonia sp. NPDC058248]|uniref:thioredoxin family protein n=1 Tax=Leifsonia sp. NPDC058248 TaxID=3346402 RepID=UPI0036D7702E